MWIDSQMNQPSSHPSNLRSPSIQEICDSIRNAVSLEDRPTYNAIFETLVKHKS